MHEVGIKTDLTCVEPSSKGSNRERGPNRSDENSVQSIKLNKRPSKQIKEDLISRRVLNVFAGGRSNLDPHNSISQFRSVVENESIQGEEIK